MQMIANRLTLVVGLLGLTGGAVALAAEATFATDKDAVAPPGSGAAASGPDAAVPGRTEEMLKKRQQDMLELHELMHRIRDAKEPQEKSRLMDQHLQLLRDSRQGMRAHRGPEQRSGMRRGRQGGPVEAGPKDSGSGEAP